MTDAAAGRGPAGTIHEHMAMRYAIAESPAVFYVESARDRRLLYVSDNVANLTGEMPVAFVDKSVDQWVDADDRHVVEAARRAAQHADDGEAVRCDYRLRTGKGVRWVRDERRMTDDHTFIGCLVDISGEKKSRVASTVELARRRKSERELRDREQLVSSVMDACPIPIAMMGFDGSVLYQNPSSLAAFGAAEHELSNLLGSAAGCSQLQELRAHGAIDDVEQEYEGADGGRFWGAVSARVVDHAGAPVIVASVTDITARKDAEVKLRESTEIVRRVLQAAPLPIRMVQFDGEGRLLYESPAAKSLFGDARDAAEVFVDLDDRRRLNNELRNKGFFQDAEMALKRADGSRFMGAVSGRIIDYQGRSVIVTTTVDLTERHAMAAELRESEELVRYVLESCPIPIQMSLLDGRMLYQSPATLELFRETREHTIENVVERYLDPAVRHAYVAALCETGSLVDYHVEYRRYDGTSFPCATSSRLLDFKGEQVIVSAFYDRSEDIARESELTRQRETLHQSEKLSAMGELLAGVAHELNNPLSIVVGQTRLLEETTTDARAAERAAKIANAADRCARIVKTFLAMARQQPHKCAAIDINHIIVQALEVIAYSISSADVRLNQQLSADLPTVWADADQLGQVIVNLLINAQHALQDQPGDSEITIASRYRRGDQQVVVEIRDNGPGVPEALRSRIFEPFFTTKDVGVGTGVGLAFCHRVLAAHGGTIILDPAHQPGASFAIHIPLAVRSCNGDGGDDPVAPAFSPLSVLVLDDEQEVRDMIAEMLRNDGHRVSVAHSGRVGLSLIEQQTFDVILSDLRMPDLDGPGLYAVLQNRWPGSTARLAFITGDTMSTRASEFLAHSGCPVIEKPLLPEDVRRLIAGFAGRRHKRLKHD